MHRSREGFGPVSVDAAGAINGGGAVLRLRNGIGRIEVKKRPDLEGDRSPRGDGISRIEVKR